MPGVVEITNIDKSNADKTEEKVKKMKKKSKSTTCVEANQDKVKVAVEIGKFSSTRDRP